MQSQFTDKARTALRLAERAAGRMRAELCGNRAYPSGASGRGNRNGGPECFWRTERMNRRSGN